MFLTISSTLSSFFSPTARLKMWRSPPKSSSYSATWITSFRWPLCLRSELHGLRLSACIIYIRLYSDGRKQSSKRAWGCERASGAPHAHWSWFFMTIQEMYDMFLLEQEFRNNSPVTISWYKDQLTEFFKWLGSEDPADLNLLKFKQ